MSICTILRKSASSSIESQLGHIYAILTLRNLYVLKSQLLMISEPENEFQHRLDIIQNNHLWNRAIGWLIESYKENETKQEEIIQKIDEFSAIIRNEYFGEPLVDVIK